MPLIRIPKTWEIPERQATPEEAYLNRRKFLAQAGIAAAGATGALAVAGLANTADGRAARPLYPVKRNPAFKPNGPLTDEGVASHYNNFFEFTHEKDKVWKLVDRFKTEPWTIRVSGLVHKPQTFDVSKLIRRMPLEERIYRHRCVEAWSMAVPWTGFPFKNLIDLAQPTSQAKFIRMLSFMRPDEAQNQKDRPTLPWPESQGLSLAEAMNELAFMVTGLYGHELPKSNGAPIRLAVPWKYGFKSLKSIVSIEFVTAQPRTFWNELYPKEYHFVANVDPTEMHGNRTQATERDIGTGEPRPTLPYNGYGKYVAHLYPHKAA